LSIGEERFNRDGRSQKSEARMQKAEVGRGGRESDREMEQVDGQKAAARIEPGGRRVSERFLRAGQRHLVAMTARALRLGLVDAEVLESNRGEDVGVQTSRRPFVRQHLGLNRHALTADTIPWPSLKSRLA